MTDTDGYRRRSALPLDHVQVRIFEHGEPSDYDAGRRDERTDVIALLEGAIKVADKASMRVDRRTLEIAIEHIRSGVHATHKPLV